MTQNPKESRDVTVPAPNSDAVVERIKQVIGDEGVRKYARRAGLKTSTLQATLSGRSLPGLNTLVAIARAGGVSIDWLATGEEAADRASLYPEAGTATLGLAEGANEPLGSGFVMIPRYDVTASAGHGSFAEMEAVLDYMAFREEFVRRTLRVDPARLALITAVGDSMLPTISPGDLLLIDRSVDRIVDDAIYVLVKRGELVVKRVQQFFDGAVTIKSDNAAYVEETLGADDADQVQVAGRVRWIGRLI